MSKGSSTRWARGWSADAFELNGWDVRFTGANTPTTELQRMMSEDPPDLAALSLAMVFNLHSMRDALCAIREHIPALPVIIGGRGLDMHGSDLALKFDVVYLRQLIDLGSELAPWQAAHA